MRRALAVLAVVAVGSGAAWAGAPAGARDILTMESYWRWHQMLRPPTIEPKAPGAAPEVMPYIRDNANHRGCDAETTPAPPDTWMASEFDDLAWPRSRGKWLSALAARKLGTMVLTLRGRFNVTDPAQVKGLYLSVTYHGGVRVFLNGQEVARQHVPAGELTPETPAEAYPAAAFVDAAGQVVNSRDADRPWEALRVRRLGPVQLPPTALKKGVNVLAIEVRRTHYHPSIRRWYIYPAETRKYPWWPTGRLIDARLQAVGDGVQPNVSRPPGTQVWVHDRNDRVYAVDYGDPLSAPAPVRLAGVRNAEFCGQLVVGSTQPIKGLKVTPAALTAVSGPGSIPAENVTVLYGAAPVSTYGVGTWFRNLTAAAPAEVAVFGTDGAVEPVLLRVRVPRDAPPGDYRGSVAVTANGQTFEVPLELSVADWAAPDPRKYQTYIGLYQSPISVALQYKVAPWSDEHFKKMERSFDLLARVGNRMVNICVVDETQFGEPEGMIDWVRKPGGTFDYDFTRFDRYLKMVVDRCGPQDYVCLQVWHAGGWEARSIDNKVTVPVVDPASGKREAMQVPRWGTPEAVAFWKPFFAAVQARLEALGMPKAMVVGILSDSTAPAEVFKTLSDAFPGGEARWHRGCHTQTDSKVPYRIGPAGSNGVVVLHEHCYGTDMMRPEKAEKGLPTLFGRRGWPATAYYRVSNHENNTSWIDARSMAERALWMGKQGLGRICLDFWPVIQVGGSMTDVYNRYPHSSCAQREPSLKSLTWPGPEGAETTFRFEAFAEGMAEAEALAVVSEALSARRAQLPADLAQEIERLLIDRLQFLWVTTEQAGGHYHTNHSGWQDLNRRLFAAAARVSAKPAA